MINPQAPSREAVRDIPIAIEVVQSDNLGALPVAQIRPARDERAHAAEVVEVHGTGSVERKPGNQKIGGFVVFMATGMGILMIVLALRSGRNVDNAVITFSPTTIFDTSIRPTRMPTYRPTRITEFPTTSTTTTTSPTA
jgi:hypothetical protein